MTKADFIAVLLTIKLATIATILLLLLGAPIAWFVRKNSSWTQRIVRALVSLPLVLPPTVLGFYLLIFAGPNGPLGKLMLYLNSNILPDNFQLQLWPFSFKGLVFASVIYSMPFVVQPLQNAFESLSDKTLEVAATLRASPLDTFFTVIIPQTKNSFLTAMVLGFAHTVGEFGVVLMIGGNIPGITQVISMQIFSHVEAQEYTQAHYLSAGMVIFSFIVLFSLQLLNKGNNHKERYGNGNKND